MRMASRLEERAGYEVLGRGDWEFLSLLGRENIPIVGQKLVERLEGVVHSLNTQNS